MPDLSFREARHDPTDWPGIVTTVKPNGEVWHQVGRNIACGGVDWKRTPFWFIPEGPPRLQSE